MADTVGTRSGAAPPQTSGRGRLALIILEIITGSAAVSGGVQLALQPNGSLISANPTDLRGSPFGDYLWPGLLLVAFVGIGFLGAAALHLANRRIAPAISIVAGCGLIAFQAVEGVWVGFHLREVVNTAIGVAVALLGLREYRYARSPYAGRARS